MRRPQPFAQRRECHLDDPFAFRPWDEDVRGDTKGPPEETDAAHDVGDGFARRPSPERRAIALLRRAIEPLVTVRDEPRSVALEDFFEQPQRIEPPVVAERAQSFAPERQRLAGGQRVGRERRSRLSATERARRR